MNGLYAAHPKRFDTLFAELVDARLQWHGSTFKGSMFCAPGEPRESTLNQPCIPIARTMRSKCDGVGTRVTLSGEHGKTS